MKKILSFIIIAVLCLGVLSSCDVINGLINPHTHDYVGGVCECGEIDPNATFYPERAAEYIVTQYNKENPVTASDYEVYGQVRVGGVVYTVDWSVDNELVKLTDNGATWLVDVDEKADAEHNYKLTGLITAPDGTTATVSFDRTVPEYAVLTFDEYMAAEDGDIVTVEGIVVAINAHSLNNKYNHLYLMDASGKGGYYCYKLSADPVEAGIKVGMTVSVSGEISPYSGMQEIYNGSFQIVDETIKTFEPVDVTEQFAAGEPLTNFVAMPVVIKGVTIGAQDLEKDTSQYLYFSIGEEKGYVRTYVSDFINLTINKEGDVYTSPDKATIDGAHAEKFGWTANVTGILVLYGVENPYIIPTSVDCFEYLEFVEKTADEKIAAELDGLSFESSYNSDTTVELPLVGAYYNDVTISWASDNEAIAIADGKATIVIPENAATVKLTATLTCGEKTETKEFEVKLSKSLTSIPAVNEIAAGLTDKGDPTAEKYLVAGIVTEIANTTYGNLYITDSQGNKLYIYGLYDEDGNRYDAMATKPAVGDYIVVYSVIGHYNNPQLKNAVVNSLVPATSISDAINIGNGYEKNNYTEDKYIVSGTITEVQNSTYGNVVIKDAEGNSILVYGLYNDDGTVRYDALTVKPAVGDTITVYGIIGKYNDPQLKNAWLVAHEIASTEGGETHSCVDANNDYVCDDAECGKIVEPAKDSVLTIEQALKLAELYKNETGASYTTNWYYISGTLGEITSTKYGTTTLTDGTHTIAVYGLKDSTGENRYEYMTTKPVAGDTVKLYGQVGAYMSSVQLNNSNVVEHTAAAGGETGGETETPVVTEGKYVFADYTAGEQYAVGEVHKLDDKVTVTTNECHFTSQLRIYYVEVGNANVPEGRNGNAVFTLASAAKKFVVSAGGKTGKIAVYGSTDGENWTLLTTLEPTSTYTEYEVALGDAAYTSLKLAGVNAQARVDYVIIEQ